MSNRIAIVASTQMELAPFIQFLQREAEQVGEIHFQVGECEVDLLFSGIGILETTFNLLQYLQKARPDGWIQAGIGGAFDPLLSFGTVYQIHSEVLAGFGAGQPDGTTVDPFSMGWKQPNDQPYLDGKLICPYRSPINLPSASGMTTFQSHGHPALIEWLRKSVHGQIENMEGAAFFYVSLMQEIPFLSMRAISNRVETRDTTAWDIPGAIQQLHLVLLQMLHAAQWQPMKLFQRL